MTEIFEVKTCDVVVVVLRMIQHKIADTMPNEVSPHLVASQALPRLQLLQQLRL